MRFIPFFLIVLVGACNGESEESPSEVVTPPPTVPTVPSAETPAKAPVTKSDWSIVDRILMRHDGYIKILELRKHPYGSDFKPEYFEQLKLRKKATIAWTMKAKPTVTFIGQRHMSLSGGNTPWYVPHFLDTLSRFVR